MRIAYVCADVGVPVFGTKGCSIHVQEVVRAMQGMGARVELFASRLGGSPSAGLSGVRVQRLPRPSGVHTAERERFCLAANDHLKELLETNGPYDAVYERYSLWSHAAMVFAEEAGVPGILEVNAPLIEEQARHRVLSDVVSAKRVAHRAFESASTLVAVSAGIVAYLGQVAGIESKIRLVPNGVDSTRFHPHVVPLLADPGLFTIGFVGSMKAWHGLRRLLESFRLLRRECPQTRLLIVGDGPQRAEIAELSGELGIKDGTVLAGAVSPEEVPGWLTSMDAAVAPYPPGDSFYFSPLKVYEYMAAGLPTVASRIGGLQDLIEDKVSGLLCKPGSTRALTDKLSTLIRNPGLGAQLGKAARQIAVENHSWMSRVETILQAAGLEPETRACGAEVPV